MTHSRSDTLTRLLAEADWLARLARGLTSSDDLAGDIAQETWLTALRSPPRHTESPRGWLATVARRVVSRRARTDGRREAREQAVGRPAPYSDPARLTARVEMQRRVAEAVLSLDEPYRSVVVMRYFEDRTPTGIAAALSVPAATVRTRLHRALAILRGRLDDEHGGDRRAWFAVLLPLVPGRADAAAATVGAALTGGFLISMKTWMGAALVVAAAAVAITVVPDLGTESPPAPKGEEAPEPVAAVPEPPPEEVPVPPAPEVVKEPAKPPPAVDREATALRGRVVGPDKMPVVPAEVFVSLDRKRMGSREHTGLDGRFLVVVPAGTTNGDLVVDAPGFLPLIRPLDALLAAAEEEQEFVLSPGLSITGHIRDETGHPVKTWLQAHPAGARGNYSHLSRHAPIRRFTRASSDEAGRFTLRGLAPGPYVMMLATRNYREGEGSIVSCEAGGGGITLIAYRTVAVALRIHYAGSDRPVTEAVGFSLFPNGEREQSGQTTSGRVTLRGLPSGKCHIVVTAPNCRPFGRTIELSLDDSPITVDVPLVRSAGHGFGTIAGTVVAASGGTDPLPGFQVYVPEFGGLFGFDGGEQGHFEIARVPAGVYQVRAASRDGLRASRHETVTVADGVRSEVRLALEPAGQIVLAITGRDDCVEESVEFRLYDKNSHLACRLPSPRFLHLAEDILLGSFIPGSARILAVARGRTLARAEVAITAGRDVRVVIALPRTAEGAPAAPRAPAVRPMPAPGQAHPAPAAPPREDGAAAEVAALIEKLASRDQVVRFDAVVELGKLGDAAPVRTLTHVVENDPDYFVRRMAIRALGGQGRRAVSAVPVIAQALSSKNPFVADAAAIAIAAITGKALPYRKGMTKEQIAAAAEKLIEEVSGE